MVKLEISEEYLDNVLKSWSKTLVGRVLKRVETESDVNKVKAQIKDVIYENIRDLKTQIKSFNWGVRFNRTNSDKR